MGKTKLLPWLGEQEGHAFCTTRQLRNIRPDPRLLGTAWALIDDRHWREAAVGEWLAKPYFYEAANDATGPSGGIGHGKG